jgi:hypothetical protein
MDKKVKVFIKDFDAVLEEDWDVNPETINKLADENGYLYATTVIEKGEKKYYFLKKHLWDTMEEVEDIFSQPHVPDVVKQEMATRVAKRGGNEQDHKFKLPTKITDLIDKIDVYLDEMRKKDDKEELPKQLTGYIWNFFRDTNPDKEELTSLAIFIVDHTYRYSASATQVDDYTKIYFASVITELWDAIQSRGVDVFYILDNALREDRFLLTIQLFALSGIAVVSPYVVKGKYHQFMTVEEQAKWALSFSIEDFDPNKVTITMDSSEFLRQEETLDLIKKYMKKTRNVAYIEKDDSVNYLDEVQKLAKDSNYVSIFRNNAPENPEVTILSK